MARVFYQDMYRECPGIPRRVPRILTRLPWGIARIGAEGGASRWCPNMLR